MIINPYATILIIGKENKIILIDVIFITSIWISVVKTRLTAEIFSNLHLERYFLQHYVSLTLFSIILWFFNVPFPPLTDMYKFFVRNTRYPKNMSLPYIHWEVVRYTGNLSQKVTQIIAIDFRKNIAWEFSVVVLDWTKLVYEARGRWSLCLETAEKGSTSIRSIPVI